MFNPGDTFPYIGLRPFSEDDSLYFKGRDEQIIQLTALLEANKFLMVTGASGDGKSSLVYAGLVPNARAGFFQARYTNWVVADFRPERTPLYNLSKTISRNLRIGNEESVEVELRRGFSSLLELYTTSSLYVDEASEVWKAASETERDELQRKAANLLIVADQFEEFFTNPENYYKNSPSADSQLVINLLLETAKISIAKNLPVYIVCTMRSDYIGQCAAFRGLPEFIGFSQFFVPRLKRKEMVQVVKEPAALHGDKISNRLVERVVYDLGEGVDQLPVLEHAMNEIWIQAKNGQEELDLIHYAMAGGMPVHELPPEDREKFNAWFSTLPVRLREAYQRPGLSHIIDTHANKLYLSAADYYNQKHEKKITAGAAQQIIKVAFTCLTKMDEGRAVRNRMTLQEITDILSRPELTTDVVGGVLNIFREAGNTFLRPYITDDPETQTLKPDSVLDITHESLIRNWELLLTWAKEEYDHLIVYEDFKRQLDRWLASNKSRGFLLPIGPLTFFENWNNTLQPNKFWINRYLDPGLDKETRLQVAQRIVNDTLEFLHRSARKVRVTRLVVKYGAARIGVVIGAIFILGLCGFYYYDAKVKENDRVIQKILAEGMHLAVQRGVPDVYRTMYAILSESLQPGSFKKVMAQIDEEERPFMIGAMQVELLWASTTADPSIRKESLIYLDSLIQAMPQTTDDAKAQMKRVTALERFVTLTSFYLLNRQDGPLGKMYSRSLNELAKVSKLLLTKSFDAKDIDVSFTDSGLEYALHYKLYDADDIRGILSAISPFENNSAKARFAELFPKGEKLSYSVWEEIDYKAGYQQLAYLYAALGDTKTVNRCVDSLMRHHPDYYNFQNNIFNIANYVITYGKGDVLDDMIAHYCRKQKLSEPEFYERWLSRAGILSGEFLYRKMVRANHNPNLDLSDESIIRDIFTRYQKAIVKSGNDPVTRDFNLALFYKHQGVLLSKVFTDRGEFSKIAALDSLFQQAVIYYQKIPGSYLDQYIEVTVDQVQQRVRRKDLFLYPDHYLKVFNNRAWTPRYLSDAYFNYLHRKGLFSTLYNAPRDFMLINDWLTNYYDYGWAQGGEILHYTAHLSETLLRVDSLFSHHPVARNVNGNLVRLLIVDDMLDKSDGDEINEYVIKIEPSKFNENLKQGKIRSQIGFFYLVNRLTAYLAMQGRSDEIVKIVQQFPHRANKIKLYSMAAREMAYTRQGPQEIIYPLLDSAISEMNRIKNFEFTSFDPRIALVLAIATVGGTQMNDLAKGYVESLSITRQNNILQRWMEGISASGNYYLAYSSIPAITAPPDRLDYINLILLHEAIRRSTDSDWTISLKRRLAEYTWQDINFEADLF
jgi:energy-coupling factor transporter ATP-binding protein EcfA2